MTDTTEIVRATVDIEDDLRSRIVPRLSFLVVGLHLHPVRLDRGARLPPLPPSRADFVQVAAQLRLHQFRRPLDEDRGYVDWFSTHPRRRRRDNPGDHVQIFHGGMAAEFQEVTEQRHGFLENSFVLGLSSLFGGLFPGDFPA